MTPKKVKANIPQQPTTASDNKHAAILNAMEHTVEARDRLRNLIAEITGEEVSSPENALEVGRSRCLLEVLNHTGNEIFEVAGNIISLTDELRSHLL